MTGVWKKKPGASRPDRWSHEFQARLNHRRSAPSFCAMLKSDEVYLRPIGVLHTPFRSASECPRQGSITDHKGEAEIFQDYAPGLKSIEKFSHIWLVYKFNSGGSVPIITTPGHSRGVPRGLFATRSPFRPNPIGITLVKILEVSENRIRFVGADMIDKTELLDIKPYVPAIDSPNEKVDSAWLENSFSETKDT